MRLAFELVGLLAFAYVGYRLHLAQIALRESSAFGAKIPHGASGPPIDGQTQQLRSFKWDVGKQALEILRRGEDCNWYSLKRTGEMHEDFDCLEIYWRTQVRRKNIEMFDFGPGPFEERAGFRVRWRVSAAHTGYVEAVGLDLMATILAARALADEHIERTAVLKKMRGKHPALEAWKGLTKERTYSFHGLQLEKWSVRLEYPGGMAFGEHEDLDEAVREALSRAPS